MLSIFFTASGLLAGFFCLRYIEVVRGVRVGAGARLRLDTVTLEAHRHVRARLSRVREYVNRDTLVKMLHMLTYLVLLFVRLLERRLTRVIARLRSFRRKRPARGISPGLEKVVRGVDADE